MAIRKGLLRFAGTVLFLNACGVAMPRQALAEDEQPTAATAAAAPVASQVAAPAAAPAEKEPARAGHPLTIVANEGEAKRIAAIGEVVHGWPLKVVPPSREDGGAPASAAFAVGTALQPADKTGQRGVKLFTEHLHILAGPQIASVEDLRGRTVSFGADGSGSQIAARKAFRALGIAVSETSLDLDNALDGVATGDVAAVAVLAPQPMPRLKALSQSGLHLVAWPEGGAIPAGTVASTIAAGAYANLAGGAVPALGVEAFLTLTPHGRTLPAAKRFMEAMAQHAPALSKRGFELMAAHRERHDDHVASAADRH